MASWVAKKCKTPITIKYPTGTISDGKPTFTEVSGTALVSDFSQSDIDYFGKIQDATSFLVAPLEVKPPVNAKITCEGKTYDLKAVKTYKNGKGEVLAYKCAAVGA
jgi:hypothetical protein